MLLGGELQIDTNYSNFEIFENTLYLKSGSMPLSLFHSKWVSKLFWQVYLTLNKLSHSRWKTHPFSWFLVFWHPKQVHHIHCIQWTILFQKIVWWLPTQQGWVKWECPWILDYRGQYNTKSIDLCPTFHMGNYSTQCTPLTRAMHACTWMQSQQLRS